MAGAFVLSTGLLISVGGAAIATAETDSSAPTGTQATEGTTEGAGAAAAGATVTQSTSKQSAGQAETNATGANGAAGPEQAGASTDPTTTGGESDNDLAEKWIEAADTDADGSGAVSTVTTTTVTTRPVTTTPGTTTTGTATAGTTTAGTTTTGTTTNSTPNPQPSVLASDSNVPAAGPDASAGDSTVATSNSNVVAPTTNVSPLMTAFQPVTNAINTVTGVVESVPARVAALPMSRTPVIDVITSVQEMFTTVAGAVVPLAQLPSDLYAMLGVPQTGPSLIGRGGVAAFTLADSAAPLFGPQATQVPVSDPSPSWDGPLFGTATRAPGPGPGVIAPPSGQGVEQLSVHGMAQLAPEGLRPPKMRSLLEHVVTAVLVPASLTALVALALPGIGGLLAVSAVGIRLGYRQAKAGLALRTSGIARFAGPGPIGVVRSGSLITLHNRTPRAPHPVRREPAPAVVRRLERVA